MHSKSLFLRAGALFTMSAAGAAGFVGCTTSPTEIVAGMTTQMQVPKHLKSVGVVVHLGGRLVFCQAYDVSDGTVRLPSTLGVIPQEGREEVPLEPVTVSVLGFNTAQGESFNNDCVVNIPDADADEVLVVRRRRLPYASERILYLPMPLKESCTGVACPDDQTCLGGVCEPNLLTHEEVVDYNDSLLFGTTNTCFEPKTCFPSTLTLPAVLTDPSTCTFRYPDPPEGAPALPPGLNVEVVYQSSGSEVLDLDPVEGFIVPDPAEPFTFRLAANLCASNYQSGKIVALRAAPGCPAKRPLQPICLDALSEIQSGSRAPMSQGVGPFCPASGPLQATESALYVLMDRSASMADAFGPSGLQFAIETPLKNPVAAQTRLAFSFLPADATACGASPNPFSSPDLGFDDAEAIRTPLADAVGDPSNVLADDPMLFLDAAMQGAYDALAGLTPSVSTTFNRRALVIIGNRDFQAHCPAGTSPAELAAAARASGIYTYVAVVDAPAGAEQFGGDPESDAFAIAQAGGTEVFNAVQDEVQGALAVQSVVNDLGSCVYELPADTSILSKPDLRLSYVDPVGFARHDIAPNPACSGEAAVDGWAIDGDVVRICGNPCEELRSTLDKAATFFALQLVPAPQIPIYFAVPCE